MILSIETSCDDTAVAVLDDQGSVRASLSANQDTSHKPFGGVVPEVASRRHSENLLPLVDEAMKKAAVEWPQIKGIAVTARPGLIGSLLVGVVTAKTLSLLKNIPLIGVNHIEGHLLAAMLKDDQYQAPAGFGFPFLGLVVSGGHTHLFAAEKFGTYKLLGHTLDDAAGEAFDKFGKMLGLGFPGGVQVDKLSAGGNPRAYQFPRGLLHEDNLKLSFSGLKSAAARQLDAMTSQEREDRKSDLCASYQAAIVEVLVAKMKKAAKLTGYKNWTVTGGVSANSGLRAAMTEAAGQMKATLALPPLRYCTDNAAMTGLAGLLRLQAGETSDQDLSPVSSSLESDWTV